MSTEKPRAESLRRELAAAFVQRKYPGHDAIADTSRCDDEAFEAQDWLRGKTWQELLAEGMGPEHRDLLSFITPEAWLYYFPAFATFGLDTGHPAEMAEILPLKLAWSPHIIKPFVNLDERRAIAHVLAYWADAWDHNSTGANVPRYALETHWRETCADQATGDHGNAPPRHCAEALQAEIQAAFAARVYPGDDRLSDTAQFGEGAAESGRWLQGKTWQELLAEGDQVWQGHLITRLLPKAWLYYFPAFATLTLEPEHPARLQNDLLVKLTWFPQQLEPFLEPAERQAIVHFLEFWADAYAQGRYDSDLPKYALTIHWAKARQEG